MKKLLLLLLLAAGMAAQAQLQNMDFEEWEDGIQQSYYLPSNWKRSDGVLQDGTTDFYHPPATDAQNGDYALRLSLWYTYVKDMAYQEAPINSRPTSLTGHYTYTDNLLMRLDTGETVIDTARVFVYMTKWNESLSRRDTIGTGILKLNAADQYTAFSCPITYTSDAVPDKIKVLLDCSIFDRNTEEMQSGLSLGISSFFTIDNLALTPQALSTDNMVNKNIRLYPNPVSNKLFVDNFSGTASIYDIAGKQVLSQAYNSGIDVSGFTKGVYLLKLQTENGASTHKFIKQ